MDELLKKERLSLGIEFLVNEIIEIQFENKQSMVKSF